MEVPYALRHAAVSTWLRTTGDPALVARWAGHSVAVLLKVYAKTIDGTEQASLDRSWAATRRDLKSRFQGTNRERPAVSQRPTPDTAGHCSISDPQRSPWSETVSPGVAGVEFEPT